MILTLLRTYSRQSKGLERGSVICSEFILKLKSQFHSLITSKYCLKLRPLKEEKNYLQAGLKFKQNLLLHVGIRCSMQGITGLLLIGLHRAKKFNYNFETHPLIF